MDRMIANYYIEFLPDELRERVLGLKEFKQRSDYHPEGNVYNHTANCIDRTIKYKSKDLSMAALFHDIGKDTTEGYNEKHGFITHRGHEKISSALVYKYRGFIKGFGANPLNVFMIVRHHMRMKKFQHMREFKQSKMMKIRNFKDIALFSVVIDIGG